MTKPMAMATFLEAFFTLLDFGWPSVREVPLSIEAGEERERKRESCTCRVAGLAPALD